MKRSGLFLIVTFLFSVSCTEKGKPYAQHEGTRVPVQSNVLPPPESENVVSLKGMSLSELSAKVLDPNVIRQKKTQVSRQSQDELILLNRMILETSAEKQQTPEFQNLLKRYAAALQTDCTGFTDGCIGLAYFDRAPSSASVAKLIAKNNPPLYFIMLQYAIKLKPVGWDPEIPQMLLRKPESAADQKHAQAVQSMLETALQSMQQRSKDKAESRRFLESINAWTLISKRDWAQSDAGGTALYAMLADTGMLYAADGTLHPGLLENIRLQSENPVGFIQNQKILLSQKDFKVEAIGLKVLPQMDEMLYLIDAVYTGTIPAEGGARLFASSKRSGKDLEIAAQNYLRMQFVSTLLESTRLASKIFDNRVQVEDMLFNAIRQSTLVQTLWSTFRTRVLPLQKFVITAARQRPDSQEIEDRLRTLFESIDKTISLTSVYPHELVLFHKMSQKRFTMTFPGGTVIQSDEVIRRLFEGTLNTLFHYAESEGKMGQLELLHAVDMAIRTNLMQSAGVDPDFFIADTVSQLSTQSTAQVESGLGKINAYLDKNTSYVTFKNACEEFRSGALQPRQHHFEQNEVSPYYGTLIQSAFMSIDSGAATASPQPFLFFADKAFLNLVEVARLDLGNTLRNGDAMHTSYRSYLKLLGLNEAQIDQKTERTRKELGRIRALREKVLKLSAQWFRDIGFCFYQAAVKDIEVQEKVVLTEKAYLRDIHHKLKTLRDPSVSAAEKRTITESIRMSGLPSGFTGQDAFVNGGFNYAQIDLLIRISRYLSTGLKTDKETFAPIGRHVLPNFGYKLDIDSQLVTSGKQTIIPYSEDEETFVNSGLQIAFAKTDSYLRWFGKATDNTVTFWNELLGSMIGLYRLEKEARGTSTIFKPEEILNVHENAIKYVQITDVQRDLFRITGLGAKFLPMQFGDVMLSWNSDQKRISNLWGLYDFPVIQVEKESLGAAAQSPMRLTYITAGEQYFALRTGRSLTIIPFSPDLDKHLNSDVRRFIRTEVETIRGFHSAANDYFAKVQARPSSERPRFDYSMFGSVSSPIVEPNIIRSWEFKIRDFNQRTGYCFEAGKTCAQFGEQ